MVVMVSFSELLTLAVLMIVLFAGVRICVAVDRLWKRL